MHFLGIQVIEKVLRIVELSDTILNFHPPDFRGRSDGGRFTLFAFKRLCTVDKWGRYYRTIDCRAEGIALLAPAKPANLLTSRAPIHERAGKRRTIEPATCLYKRIPCSSCPPPPPPRVLLVLLSSPPSSPFFYPLLLFTVCFCATHFFGDTRAYGNEQNARFSLKKYWSSLLLQDVVQ